jgi:hypothetical protein
MVITITGGQAALHVQLTAMQEPAHQKEVSGVWLITPKDVQQAMQSGLVLAVFGGTRVLVPLHMILVLQQRTAENAVAVHSPLRRAQRPLVLALFDILFRRYAGRGVSHRRLIRAGTSTSPSPSPSARRRHR